MSRSSSNNWIGDDRRIDNSFCRKGVKCFTNSFIYDFCLSSFVRIFIGLFGMQMTKKTTPGFVEMAWNFSVTALYTIVLYHQLSGSSLNVWKGNDSKSDTSICRKGLKCFTNSFRYDICQHLHRLLEMEMTRKAIPQFVKTAWSVAVTALDTIDVSHQLSGSSWNNWIGDDKKNDTSLCRKGVKCFTNSFLYDCRITSIERIFTDYLKWRWQEKRHLILSKGREVLQ